MLCLVCNGVVSGLVAAILRNSRCNNRTHGGVGSKSNLHTFVQMYNFHIALESIRLLLYTWNPMNEIS